jgi:hypothetical protein
MTTDRTVTIGGQPYEVAVWYAHERSRRFLIRYDEVAKRVHYQTYNDGGTKVSRTCTAAAWVKWVDGA